VIGGRARLGVFASVWIGLRSLPIDFVRAFYADDVMMLVVMLFTEWKFTALLLARCFIARGRGLFLPREIDIVASLGWAVLRRVGRAVVWVVVRAMDRLVSSGVLAEISLEFIEGEALS
jgi:hypothetical protein